RTHWVTPTNFIGFLLLPRFRAYLGASKPWFGGASSATPVRRLTRSAFVSRQGLLNGLPHAHRSDGERVQRLGVANDRGVSQPLNQVSPALRCARGDEGQPKARQVGGQQRYGDQPPPQSFLAGVFADHAAVGNDIRAPDLEDAAFAG